MDIEGTLDSQCFATLRVLWDRTGAIQYALLYSIYMFSVPAFWVCSVQCTVSDQRRYVELKMQRTPELGSPVG